MTTRLRLFPLNTVLFPGTVLNLHVFEPRYRQLIAECLESGESFGVALIFEGDEAGDPAVMPHDVGSTAEIVEVTQLPFGRYYVSTVGRERFRIVEVISREPYITVDAELIEENFIEDRSSDDLADRARALFIEYAELIVELSGKTGTIQLPSDAQRASFIIGDGLQISDAIKQQLLETTETKERLDLECQYLERALPQLRALLERRREAMADREIEEPHRAEQAKFFGKFFSAN